MQDGLPARAPGLGGFNFSRRIAGKYSIFRKSGRLPSLIFLRLSGMRVKNKKFAHRVSTSNYLKFQFGFYFEFIRQLIKTPDNYYLQKLYNFINSKNEGYLPQTDKRPGQATKTSEKTAIGVLSHIPFAPPKVSGFFGQSWRGLDFKRNPIPRLHIRQYGDMINDFQQRNGLTFFNNSATYQGYRTSPHKQLSSSYPGQDDKKTIQPLPSGIKASNEEVSSGPARAIMNVRPPEGTNAFRKEITVSDTDYEHIPGESGNAERNFLLSRSYLIIQPVRMVTYSANVTISHFQRLSDAWIFGSRRYQTGYSFVSGKQHEERHSFPAKIMNSLSAGKDAVSAKPLYPQNGVATDISYENNPHESGTEWNLLFTGSHLVTRPVNMTLIYSNIYSNSGMRGYLKNPPDIETGSQHSIIQAPVSGLRNPIKEREFLEPPPNRMNGLTTAKKVSRQGLAGNEVSRENIHNEKNQSLEPALPRTSGHPAAKNALHRSMAETGISHKTLPGSHLISRPLKMVLNPSNTVNFSNLKRTFNIGNILSKSNRGIHHFVPATQPSNNENQSGEPSRINADGTLAGIRDMTEKGTESFRQERTIVDTRYENIIREYEKTGRKNTIRAHRGGTILKPAEDQFSDLVFPRHGIDLKYGIPNDMKTPMEVSTRAYNSSLELILKKPVVQKTENIPENREQAGKTAPPNINDTFIREYFREKPLHEINRIADTVYKMIEKRISIEKDRRGLS
ncbi:MAG: hypothetical protein O8C62_04130 [Candidatus Methanoperedens sp.]|nr:hypothetical protein [Candidatus Methanoperedens sp.]